tara:strand:+ start:21981 stop:23615 length:1635 start_codon:yes stop_codon:yes gene_type:complete
MIRRIFIAVVFWMVTLTGAQAQTGLALIIANQDYDQLRNARGADSVLQTVRRFEEMGFRVELATDRSAAQMQAALADLSQALQDQPYERVIVVYAGYVVSAKFGTWLMGTNAGPPRAETIETQGVRLRTVLDIAASRQGGAIVAVADYGFPAPGDEAFDAGLPDDIDVPQGVSLLRGSGPGITEYLRAVVQPGVNVGALSRRRGNVELLGFDPRFLTFLPVDHEPVIDAEAVAWAAASEADSIEAYETYLSDYPDGANAAQARAALAALQNTPERIEAALGLSRNERRAIQRDLTILEFDPRGIDGLFGRLTRAAIRAWQGANGIPATGFLDRAQIFSLAQQGAQRAAQLEAEARARQQAEERRDRAYWRDTGSGQDEVGLRAYLERFPDGIFANVAQERLDRIEADRRAAAEARDRAAWDGAVQLDTIPAYRGYLRDFPTGSFADEARARIAQLQAPQEPEVDLEAERAREAALNLPQFTRVLIERRLATLGLEPGPQDGRFDRQTRRAIRRYQRASDLPVTGFLTEAMVARLMTEGVLDILR